MASLAAGKSLEKEGERPTLEKEEERPTARERFYISKVSTSSKIVTQISLSFTSPTCILVNYHSL